MVKLVVPRLRSRALVGTALTVLFSGAAHAQSLPVGGTVVSGTASIASNGTATTVTQTSGRAIVDWTSFNVDVGKTVTFVQPNVHSATLNRVTGATSSSISGVISSNGAVYLVNPNGIVINSSGWVQTAGGFVASTLAISDSDFNAGRLNFTGNGASKSVVNRGMINVAGGAGAYVALLGGSVSNVGSIIVPLGKVGLGAGERATLDLNGDGFMQVALPSGTGTAVDMTGRITATGGRVELKAASVRDVVRNVVNLSGVVSVDNAVGDGGAIVLLGGDGGTVTATGTLSARATGANGKGGLVEVSGEHVKFNGVKVDTTAAHGKTGTWLVDPTDLTVDAAAAGTIATNLATSNVTLTTDGSGATGPGNQTPGNGDITVNSAIAWSSTNTLELDAYNDIHLNAAITGASGGLTLTAGNNVANSGAISDTAALSVGTFSLTNGAWVQNSASLPSFSADDFRIAVDKASFLRATGGDGSLATPYTLTDIYGVQGVASSSLLSRNFTLASAIDAWGTQDWNAGAGFVPIGSDGNGGGWDGSSFTSVGTLGYSGTFDGAGHVIDGLTIYRPNVYMVGLFGLASGTLQSTNLQEVLVAGGDQTGGLLGFGVNASILGSSSSGDVYGGTATGGLVGFTNGGSLQQVSATGTVHSGYYGGGLVGYSTGTNIDQSWSSASVTGSVDAGGLVGYADSLSISRSYATGSVTGDDAVGGLVGIGTTGSAILNSWASGFVTGTGTAVGGVIGDATDTSVFSSTYWDSFSTGQAAGYGAISSGVFNATEVTSDPAQSAAANYAFSASAYANLTPADWIFFDGQTRPFGAWEAVASGGTITDSHQLQLIGRFDGTGLAGTYTIGNDIDLSETGANQGTPTSSSGMWASTGWVALGTDGQGNIWNGTTFDVSGAIGFTGTIHGNDHYLSELAIIRSAPFQGLIGLTQGTIENLNLETAYVQGGPGTGMLAGVMTGGTISGVTVSGQIDANIYAGGLVGIVGGSGSPVIRDSHVYAGINGSGYLGGVVGYVNGAAGLTIQNVDFTGQIDTVGGGNYVGGIAGYFDYGNSISKASVTAAIDAGGDNVGGLVGTNIGSIDQSYFTGIVSGHDNVGGLVGQNQTGTIGRSYSTGAVNATDSVAGGLIGEDSIGTITSSWASGMVTATNGTTGGLIGSEAAGGETLGGYWDSFSTGQASAIGAAAGSGTVTATAVTSDPTQSAAANYAYKTSAYGNLTAADWVFFNGQTRPFGAWEVPTGTIDNSHQLQLIGANAITLAGSFTLTTDIDLFETGANLGTAETSGGMWSSAGFVPIGTDGKGNVWDGTTYKAVGTISSGIYGFTGSLNGDYYVVADLGINRAGSNQVGLFGVSSGSITNMFVHGSVIGGANTGGIVGLLKAGSVSGSYSVVDVSGTNLVGGLAGNLVAGATIDASAAWGNVNGTDDVGGLVGYGAGTISRSYASGSVSGAHYVGGLVGYEYHGSVTNSYAVGDATATNNAAGGLIGKIDTASVTNSYSIGVVTGPLNAGGLIGMSAGTNTITSSYWDTDTSGKSTSAGGTGKTTIQLQTQSTFVGWDFTKIWRLTGNYPWLISTP